MSESLFLIYILLWSIIVVTTISSPIPPKYAYSEACQQSNSWCYIASYAIANNWWPSIAPKLKLWLKTDQIVTLGLFHFIGSANGYTHTLHIHSAITRLDWLVFFSIANFSDHVNSWLTQWDPWRVLHVKHGSEIHPSGSEMSLRPSEHVWAYGWHFWDIASPNSTNGALTHLQLPTLTYPTPCPLVHTTCDITVVVKIVTQNLVVLAS